MNNSQLFLEYINAYNAKDVGAMMSFFDDACVFENISAGKVTVRTQGNAAQANQDSEADPSSKKHAVAEANAPEAKQDSRPEPSKKQAGTLLATSVASKLSESKQVSDRLRAVSPEEVVKAAEDRLRKIMQICRGC